MAEEISGQSFVAALHEKYDSGEQNLSIVIHIPKSAPGRTDRGCLVLPQNLALNYCRVAEAGPVSEVSDVVANITELDLSWNSLSQWDEVFKIISSLPKIFFLNVSNNPLRSSDEISWTGEKFVGIVQLALNATKVPWATVLRLLLIMPHIRELHLSLNEFSTFDLEACVADLVFPNVADLYMNGNNISSWAEVEKLGRLFPNMTHLIMMKNPLNELTGENVGAEFRSLRSLSLSETQLSSWREVEKLKTFPSLADVKLHGVPFIESFEEKLRRHLIIGYLPNATRLNGSRVDASEREDAERAFIRNYMNMNDEDKPQRYHELVDIHGELEPLVDVDFADHNSVSVTVHHLTRTCLKNFSLFSTLSDVKRTLAEELVNEPPESFDVRHGDVGGRVYVMKYAQMTLLHYHVKDGDEFYVEMKTTTQRPASARRRSESCGSENAQS